MPFVYSQDSYYFVIQGLFWLGLIAFGIFITLRLVMKLLINPVRDMFFSWIEIVRPKKPRKLA